MEKIASFTVNHLTLLPGIYVSRQDAVGETKVTTFDLRMTRPNFEPVMNTAEMHAIEHLGATFLRNHKDYKDQTIYFGPMGCRTGFYLLTLGGCVVVGLICIFSTRYMDKADKPFLLVVRADAQQALQAVEEKLAEGKVSFSLSSCVDTGSYSEAIYEVGVTEAGRSKVAALKEIPGITTVSLVDCRKEA